jgi:hypothetical protein
LLCFFDEDLRAHPFQEDQLSFLFEEGLFSRRAFSASAQGRRRCAEFCSDDLCLRLVQAHLLAPEDLSETQMARVFREASADQIREIFRGDRKRIAAEAPAEAVLALLQGGVISAGEVPTATKKRILASSSLHGVLEFAEAGLWSNRDLSRARLLDLARRATGPEFNRLLRLNLLSLEDFSREQLATLCPPELALSLFRDGLLFQEDFTAEVRRRLASSADSPLCLSLLKEGLLSREDFDASKRRELENECG